MLYKHIHVHGYVKMTATTQIICQISKLFHFNTHRRVVFICFSDFFLCFFHFLLNILDNYMTKLNEPLIN